MCSFPATCRLMKSSLFPLMHLPSESGCWQTRYLLQTARISSAVSESEGNTNVAAKFSIQLLHCFFFCESGFPSSSSKEINSVTIAQRISFFLNMVVGNFWFGCWKRSFGRWFKPWWSSFTVVYKPKLTRKRLEPSSGSEEVLSYLVLGGSLSRMIACFFCHAAFSAHKVKPVLLA